MENPKSLTNSYSKKVSLDIEQDLRAHTVPLSTQFSIVLWIQYAFVWKTWETKQGCKCQQKGWRSFRALRQKRKKFIINQFQQFNWKLFLTLSFFRFYFTLPFVPFSVFTICTVIEMNEWMNEWVIMMGCNLQENRKGCSSR